MILDRKRRIEKWYCIQNEELRNDVQYTLENWEMILYTEWKIEKWYWAEYKILQLIYNTKWIIQKWFSIKSEELKNDVEYKMKNPQMNLNIYNEELRNDIVYRMEYWEMILSGT